MDKNTIIGLGVIGVILAIFTFYNQPTEEELAQQNAQQEQLAQQQQMAEQKVQQEEASNYSNQTETNVIKKRDDEGNVVIDSSNSSGNKALAKNTEEKEFTLENNKIEVTLSNLGGGVKSVLLKNYQTYTEFVKDEEEVKPLQLFNNKKASNGLLLKKKGKIIDTRDLAFEVKKQSESYISFIAQLGKGKSIEQIYSISPDRHEIDYEIKINGFEDEVMPDNVLLEWNTELIKTERLLSEQRRVSTVFFKDKNDSYDYLSESGDDEFAAEKDIDWVAFKQSYFSSIMMPNNSFKKEGTSFEINTFDEGSEKDSTLIKKYGATMNLGLSNTANGSAKMKWYFGPNDYDLLASYENGSEDIINLGWGLFRWINVYAIQPTFNWLATHGLNLGLTILLLTLIIKLVLTPIQWKMYASSAKMRILKPEIEKINEKYPDKSDAMKKQMETMTLYRESGASPLSGCVPMLIQMPILFAVFRFFPSSFTLRQEGFLWAEDLSSFDSILDLGFHIPLYGSHVSLFTLLMALTTLFYTKLNSGNMQQPSQPGMPNMKVIMYFFPFMMIFFFNNYASGLSYYYFVSTLISILTMLAIKKFFVDEDKLKAKMTSKKESKQGAKEGKKGKSKFQERLEQMQKAQQDKKKK